MTECGVNDPLKIHVSLNGRKKKKKCLSGKKGIRIWEASESDCCNVWNV